MTTYTRNTISNPPVYDRTLAPATHNAIVFPLLVDRIPKAARLNLIYPSAATPQPGSGPLIQNQVPQPNVTILPQQIVRFNVLALAYPFAARLIAVSFSNGAVEVVHDGTKYTPLYIGGSTWCPVLGGFFYAVQRTGGWLGQPSFSLPDT